MSARMLVFWVFTQIGFTTILTGEARGAIEGVSTDVAGFVGLAQKGALDTPTPLESWDDFVKTFGDVDPSLQDPYLAPSVSAFFTNGGRRCYVVRVASSSDASYVGSRKAGTGLQSLRAVDEIATVCVPGVTSLVVQNAVIAHCEELGDRIGILDPEDSADLKVVREQRQTLDSPNGYAALYYPWIRASLLGVGEQLVPPSGFVAGVFARSDRDTGVWKPPVGGVIGAVGLAREVTTQEQDILTPEGINAIRTIPGQGIQVWGARTMSSDPEWKYVSVRRFFIYMEESIHEGTEWAVFEPNAEPLWASLRSEIDALLFDLWKQGALQGTRPDDAYFVRVDRSTMTEADIEAGRLVILVGVAPLRPAEFQILQIVQETTAPETRFVRGDANGDGAVDLSDPIGLLNYIFLGGAEPACLDAADAGDEGQLTISSAVYALNFLFLGSRPPPYPYPACGTDPTADSLADCNASTPLCR